MQTEESPELWGAPVFKEEEEPADTEGKKTWGRRTEST